MGPDGATEGKSGDGALLSTGITEIDKKVAGGIPLGSLTLVEGESDTGKSVLMQQVIFGTMKQGLNADLYSTELTAAGFLSQMEAMNLEISDYFAWGYIRVFSLMTGVKWSQAAMDRMLKKLIGTMQDSTAHVLIIDSFTVFTEHASPAMILNFLTGCKSLADGGKTILITLHSYAFEEDMLVRIRSICDAHLMMRKSLIGDKYVMVMEAVKVRGAKKTSGNMVSFEVHPGYGMKIIPISVARV